MLVAMALQFSASETNLKSHYPLPTRAKHLNPRILISCTNDNKETEHSSTAGKIKRLVLSQEGRTKLNPLPDREFYAYPRFVTHVDDNFISTLTNLYRQRLRGEWEILDLMSSWVSHLPQEVKYKRVVGHGLNAQELARNPRLDYFFVKDLNQDQNLELQNCSFDAVLCTVSVQYLQQPEKVFGEVFRILKPGGMFIVSFSKDFSMKKPLVRGGMERHTAGCSWWCNTSNLWKATPNLRLSAAFLHRTKIRALMNPHLIGCSNFSHQHQMILLMQL